MRYLYATVLDDVAVSILVRVLERCDVYVFSGVIRDYFVRPQREHRDLDIVLEHDINWYGIYRLYRKQIEVRMNSYGGFKVRIGALNIDVWTMDRTWGLVRKGIRVTPQNLVRTAFFNFSAIVYSMRRQCFYVHRSFAEFVENKEVGIVYKENPNVPLCILNSIYYSRELQMPLTKELKRWIVAHYSIFDNYETPQLSHWGVVRYNNRVIRLFVSQCEIG